VSPQRTIAHYRITAKLGEGGMGEVWRATDTKLNREVAIKIVPESFAADPDRLARFTREAQVLASLNHPNIAAIYGVEDRALIMELVEGATLAERIAAGPIPLDEALPVAKQIAEALEYAHERGVIHRDLKPANIKVTPEGRVKVLDFGLAKAITGDAPAEDQTNSPTLTMRATQAGVILGTAAYMSPEQARGKPVDKRADIWSFGVVLFEMLTGAMLFGGETVSDSMIAVVTKEPDWNALPKDTPKHVRRLLDRCLRKDPRSRLRDIGEVRVALEEPQAEPTSAPAVSPRRVWLPWMAAIVTAAAGLGAGSLWLRPKPPEPVAVRFPLVLPEGGEEPASPAAAQSAPSPDGRYVAMAVRAPGGKQSLWVRPIGSTDAHRLEGTEDANYPFWSPDGQFLAYFSRDQLKKVPAAGGTPHTICSIFRPGGPPPWLDPGPAGDGGAWNAEGTIVFTNRVDAPVMRVLAAGGTPSPAFPDQPAADVRYSWPQFLPDGRHVLYLERHDANPPQNASYVQELNSPRRVLVMQNTLRAEWAPPGWLLFGREQTLYAQRFDPTSLRLSGEALTVADGISTNENNGRAAFAAGGGTLVYRADSTTGSATLAWYRRDGSRTGAVGAKADFFAVRLSPNDRTAQLGISTRNNIDIWSMDPASGILTRLTTNFAGSGILGPWSPDSTRILANHRTGDGAAELTVASAQTRPFLPAGFYAEDWSPDGSFVLATGPNRLAAVPLADPRPQIIRTFGGTEREFRLAPDGTYVAYTSDESGIPQVMVAAYPSFAEKRQVSMSGGEKPAWRKDGKELFFLTGNTVMSTEVRTAGHIEASTPRPLFKLPGTVSGTINFRYAPTGDGQRFLVIEREQSAARSGQMVVVNWAAGLKR
jgi:Tol biopolymer transport system component